MSKYAFVYVCVCMLAQNLCVFVCICACMCMYVDLRDKQVFITMFGICSRVRFRLN